VILTEFGRICERNRMTMLIDDRLSMGVLEEGECSPGTARRLRRKLDHLFCKTTNGNAGGNNNLGSIFDSDLHEISRENKKNLERTTASERTHNSSESNQFSEEIEEEKWRSVSSILQHHLQRDMLNHNVDLFLPSNLLERISKDIVHLSASEPYGLRGCTIRPELSRKSGIIAFEAVECDVNTVSTFELQLTLSEDKKRWYNLRDLIAPVLPGCLNESHAFEVFISPNYKLTKHKLYRAN